MSLSRRPHKTTKKRRRVATVAQRRAANIRERRRMFNLNEAFDRLRNKVGVNNTRVETKYEMMGFLLHSF